MYSVTPSGKTALAIGGVLAAAGGVYYLSQKTRAGASDSGSSTPPFELGADGYNNQGYLTDLNKTPVVTVNPSSGNTATITVSTHSPTIVLPAGAGYSKNKSKNVDTVTPPQYTTSIGSTDTGLTISVTGHDGQKLIYIPSLGEYVISVYDAKVNLAGGQWLRGNYYKGKYNAKGVFIYKVDGNEPEVIGPLPGDPSTVTTIYNPHTNLFYRGPNFLVTREAAGGYYNNHQFIQEGTPESL